MSCGCGYQDVGIEGIDATDFLLMAGAGTGYLATAYLDNMIVYDEDGHKKTGKIAENDNLRNIGFVGGGVVLNVLMPEDDEIAKVGKGFGVGMAVYGIKELFKSQYPTVGIKGVNRRDPRYIANVNQRNGDPRYIGKSRSNKLDLGLNNQGKQTARKKTNKLIVKHN